MKTFVSALLLGLVLAFSAPAFAGSNAMAYFGDMNGGKPATKAVNAKTAESATTKHHPRKHVY
jgi:hypothetical protein